MGIRRRERPRMLKEQGEGEGGQRRLGWPKVARVEYWNALPEAISVRCPPFVLLSCPLQASSSFPTLPSPLLLSLPRSFCLSSFLSVSSLCFFSTSVIFSLFLSFLSLSVRSSLSFFCLLRSFRKATQHLSPRT